MNPNRIRRTIFEEEPKRLLFWSSRLRSDLINVPKSYNAKHESPLVIVDQYVCVFVCLFPIKDCFWFAHITTLSSPVVLKGTKDWSSIFLFFLGGVGWGNEQKWRNGYRNKWMNESQWTFLSVEKRLVCECRCVIRSGSLLLFIVCHVSVMGVLSVLLTCWRWSDLSFLPFCGEHNKTNINKNNNHVLSDEKESTSGWMLALSSSLEDKVLLFNGVIFWAALEIIFSCIFFVPWL